MPPGRQYKKEPPFDGLERGHTQEPKPDNQIKSYAGTSRCTHAVAYWVSSAASFKLSFRLICSR
jgi:hypothetical protein